MKSFAVCFICRNILCVLTSHQMCQDKQMQPCGKQLGPTVTSVFLTCSGQLFHRAELIKMPRTWVTRCKNHLCNRPFHSKLFWVTWLGWELQFETVKAGCEKTAASKPASPPTMGSVTFFTFFQGPVLSHHKWGDTGPLDWPYLLHTCPHVLLFMVSLILSTSHPGFWVLLAPLFCHHSIFTGKTEAAL